MSGHSPPDAAAKDFRELRIIPAAALHMRPEIRKRPKVIVAATMAQRAIEDGPIPDLPQIEDRYILGRMIGIGKIGASPAAERAVQSVR